MRFLRFPSISADPRYRLDTRRCANWLAARLTAVGLEDVRLLAGSPHPVIYGARRRRPGKPTVLIYGHYDVQPADSTRPWTSRPFEPMIRGDYLFARGASDDKGPLLALLKSLDSLLRVDGELPVNVVCLFEGAEEIGSPGLAALIEAHASRLAADVALISDTRILAPDRPALIYGLRGSLALELEVRGPGHDLHSGTYGGAVHNPLQVLSELLAGLHGDDGRVAVPGFYDRVVGPGPGERAALARNGRHDREMLRDAGVSRGWGMRGYSLYERTTLLPALTINGLSGGYQGPGPRSVIPERATAKVNIRLVPDQDPDDIADRFRRHVADLTPPTVASRVRVQSRARPVIVERDHAAMRAARRAYRSGFGVDPVFLRSGGSIPVVSMFHEVLRIPTVLMGFALSGDHSHGPDERLHLPTFFRGISTSMAFFRELGQDGDAVKASALPRRGVR